MINGVLEIVAAVLFAVVALGKDFDVIWLTIAGIYLICGILNLVVYAVKNYRKQKAAEKAAAEKERRKAAETAAEKPFEVVPAPVQTPELPAAEGGNANG